MANLPVTINNFVQSPYAYWKQLAWSGALLITLTVLALNIGARILGAERSRKMNDLSVSVSASERPFRRRRAARGAAPRSPRATSISITASTTR